MKRNNLLLLTLLCSIMSFSQTNMEDIRRRNYINDFLTYYQEAYEKHQIKFIEDFFSTNALIITETKMLVKCGKELVPHTTKKSSYKHIVENKKQYLERLKKIFNTNPRIKINIPNGKIFIARHRIYKEIYGVSFLQMWSDSHNGSNIEDDMLGYVFLIIDFKQNENAPIIHVRTWQPQSNIKSNTDKFNLYDFEIYDF